MPDESGSQCILLYETGYVWLQPGRNGANARALRLRDVAQLAGAALLASLFRLGWRAYSGTMPVPANENAKPKRGPRSTCQLGVWVAHAVRERTLERAAAAGLTLRQYVEQKLESGSAVDVSLTKLTPLARIASGIVTALETIKLRSQAGEDVARLLEDFQAIRKQILSVLLQYREGFDATLDLRPAASDDWSRGDSRRARSQRFRTRPNQNGR